MQEPSLCVRKHSQVFALGDVSMAGPAPGSQQEALPATAQVRDVHKPTGANRQNVAMKDEGFDHFQLAIFNWNPYQPILTGSPASHFQLEALPAIGTGV